MIKSYKEYVNESAGVELAQEQKDWLDKCTRGRWRFNAQTGLVDVQGDFHCYQQGLDSFKGVRFGHVSGGFNCYGNKLTSLEGSPQSVGGDFYCYRNNLTSLKGFPMEIKGEIDLDPNPIWKKIEPMVKGMSADEKRFFYKFVGASEAIDKESLERIARSIERMRMI